MIETPEQAAEQLVETGRLLYERGMIAGGDGNLSVRLPDKRIVITPSGLPKGRLTSDDMVVIDGEGKRLAGERIASSEVAMHLFVYRERADVHACVHSHAPHATAFAVAGKKLPERVLPEVIIGVGPIPLTDFALPGTKAVPESLAPFVQDANAFLLRNHGVLTLGATLEEAYSRHETVDHYARILYLAREIGNVTYLSETDFRLLQEMRRTILDQPPGEAEKD